MYCIVLYRIVSYHHVHVHVPPHKPYSVLTACCLALLLAPPVHAQDATERQEYSIVSREAFNALAATPGALLLAHEAMGHMYGISLQSIKKVGASGCIPVIEVDAVADAVALRDGGLDATYAFIGTKDMGKLLTVIHEELKLSPPPGYELRDAANVFFAEAKHQMEESVKQGLFDEWVHHQLDASDASFARLAEAVHRHYPDVVTRHFVWGYGRGLWDGDIRVHGRKPLRVMVLGAAASGKSTQCEMLAHAFGLPHLNLGDLLFEEVKAKTELGLEAKVFMDATKTVPDR